MKYTIEDLRQGKCAVINDGTLEELREVLRLAFPRDETNYKEWIEKYPNDFYFMDNSKTGRWFSYEETDLPTQSVKYFIENFKKDIKDSILKSRKSIDDKIKELKELAKSQGMYCDVVLSEKKKVEVNWDGGNIQNKSFYFIYDKSVEELLIKTGFSKAGEFLAKQLEKYLNEETVSKEELNQIEKKFFDKHKL